MPSNSVSGTKSRYNYSKIQINDTMSDKQRLDFNQILEKYGQKLFNLMLRLTGNYHWAQDLTQDVLLIVYREYPKFRGESDVFTWIYRIAINYHRRQARKMKLRNWLGFDEVSSEALSTGLEGADPAENSERNKKVAQAVSALPNEFKETVILHYFQDQSCEQIASILDCSEGTVKSRLWRGRKILAQKLKAYVSETGV
jgi:RNA polymerase sigma-70 factor (ECF subfamily)